MDSYLEDLDRTAKLNAALGQRKRGQDWTSQATTAELLELIELAEARHAEWAKHGQIGLVALTDFIDRTRAAI